MLRTLLLLPQGHNDGGNAGTIPRAPNHYWSTESLRAVPNDCVVRRKVATMSQVAYSLQYSTFASERSSVRTWARQTCFLPQAPSNLATLFSMKLGKVVRKRKVRKAVTDTGLSCEVKQLCILLWLQIQLMCFFLLSPQYVECCRCVQAFRVTFDRSGGS